MMIESGWIDISVPIRDGMVHWPSDPPVQIRRTSDVEQGDSHTMSSLSFGSHTGTHIDAPAHFIKGGGSVDRIPLEALVGEARVIEISDPVSINMAEVEPLKIRRGERLLFKTRNSLLWQADKFVREFVYITDEVARYLVSGGVRLVGIDYLSIGEYRKGMAVHDILLGAGVCVVEGLNLSQVAPGSYNLVCLPLRLENGDGAPARVIIKPYRKKIP